MKTFYPYNTKLNNSKTTRSNFDSGVSTFSKKLSTKKCLVKRGFQFEKKKFVFPEDTLSSTKNLKIWCLSILKNSKIRFLIIALLKK